MFKFTQLRPVNGIDYYEVQSKHFPLYNENKPTELLKKVIKEGLPRGITHALVHIDSDGFKDKLDIFENQSVSKGTESISIYTFVSILQKIINHTYDYPLIEGKHDDLEILRYSRGMLSRYGLDESKIKEIITKIKIDEVSDDLYSLLLVSSYHAEYRRYVDTLYRFIFLMNTYTLERIFGIFFSENTSLEDEDYSILKRFLSGRILLPSSVGTNQKPLPEFEDNSDNDSNVSPVVLDPKAVKGISLSMIHQSINKHKLKKSVKKKNEVARKLKNKPSKIFEKKETRK